MIDWLLPQLCRLVKSAPAGPGWLHEIKFDGYRMGALIDRGKVRLLTRTGLDWTHRYPETAAALALLPVRSAYLDGELCGVRPDGVTSFSMLQAATDNRRTGQLVYYAFDLLRLDGVPKDGNPLASRKKMLATLFAAAPPGLHYSDHHEGHAGEFHAAACRAGLEGIVSKVADAPYRPGDRGLWRKVKCLNREEFVVVGWSDPEGRRHRLGSLLLAYYEPGGKLTYAGRVGSGIDTRELDRLWRRLQPVATNKMPVASAPPRTSRFGSPLALSRVHWVRPEMVVEVTYLTWTADGSCGRWSIKVNGKTSLPAT